MFRLQAQNPNQLIMKKSKLFKVSALAASAMMCFNTASLQAQNESVNAPCGTNLIVNGDFEAGNSGFSSEYTYKVDGPAGNELVPELTYGVGPDASTYHPNFDGLGRTGNFMIVNGNEDFVRTVWSQSVNVEAGKEYSFSIYISNVYQSEPANLRFMAGDDEIGTFTPVIDNVTQWFNFTATYTATSTGAVDIKIFTDNLTLQYGNDFGLDDISFTEVCPPTPSGCFASAVSFFNQGQTASGNDVRPERSFPTEALGAPNAQTPAVVADVQNFVSLGFGGVLEVQFANPIANGPGADIRIWESSAGNSSERSLIEVSQDGLGYLPVAEITADGEVDFADVFSDFIQFVRITDVTPNNGGGGIYTDGYDVDAVECLHGEYVAPEGCYAVEVVDFNQKKKNDGSIIEEARSDESKALGMPQDDVSDNFVSLGFGGDITLKFGSPIKNGPGADVRVIESTFGASIDGNCSRYPETIRAFASQDGCNFVYLGEGCQDTDFDLGSLAWAQYIKIVDVSEIGATYQGTPVADAYDLDGIMCLNGYEENPIPSELMLGAASEVISENQGDQKNGNPVAGARSDSQNALGMPEGGDIINFYALGFGGELVVKFDYVIFDEEGVADFRVVETTYNNATCEQYPEKAMVSFKLDVADEWSEGVEICLDGDIDLNGIYAAQYIRIQDRSMMSDFSGAADGYDVNGVVSLNTCSEGEEEIRIADNNSTPDESTSVNASPNPFKSDFRLDITTGSNDRTASINVFNFLGQSVYTNTINVASSSTISEVVNLGSLKAGVYFVTVETNTTKETIKLIKQ